jgi:hypothetical protein
MESPAAVAPAPTEFGSDFGKYIRLVPAGDVLEFLSAQHDELIRLLSPLTPDQSLLYHAPYTWSIRQVVGHMSDCERVFGYRALRLARQDATPLPGFDEQAFMQAANFDRWSLPDLVEEFSLVRQGHLRMIRQFEPAAWGYSGIVCGQSMTTRAMVYAIAGHAQHHLEIVRRRLSP